MSETTKEQGFANKVVDNFLHNQFELTAESYETTWGFRSTTGKYFKISNRDLDRALSDVLEHWDDWCEVELNVNASNPDETLSQFSKSYFSDGAHKDLAEVQRRGFLHFLNAVAYASRHDGLYDKYEWEGALEKADYEAALAIVRQYSQDAEAMSQGSESSAEQEASIDRLKGGDNELFYGAPGTGKSHNVWKSIDADNDSHFVTVFHPDMQNSDFVGTLKPGVDANGDVTYAFREGPFARAVAEAWASPGKKVYLVIEELNRAAAPAVFGELFQLLDRKEDGSSRYEVDFSSPEFAEWFAGKTGQAHERLSLPSNLWILATMNSADQGVYPLDTAFRRRWRQHYLPIDYSIAPDKDLAFEGPNGTVKTVWKTLVEALNGFLVQHLEVNEDRLIGPRFVDEHDLDEGTLPGKLLIYLWDDLLRHQTDKEPFHSEIDTYGDLDNRLNEGQQIFSDGFLETIDVSKAGDAGQVSLETEMADMVPDAGLDEELP